MIISGLQKLTLLDYPGKVACTVFLGGCNFRCPFCHNALLVERPGEAENISEEKFFDFLKKRQGVLDGVCITGGEPLLRKDIVEFALKIKSLGYSVKIDTNGSKPEMIKELIEKGAVDKFAMDIKSSLDKYTLAIGTDVDTEDIKRSVKYIMESGVCYEFRTTVVDPLHDESDFEEIGKLIEGADAYFLQSFADSGDLIDGEGFSAYSDEMMQTFLDTVKKKVPSARIRGKEE